MPPKSSRPNATRRARRHRDSPRPSLRRYAHRGVHHDAQDENTRSAFRAAAHQLEGFECDIRFSSDGVPFILHDATLQRTHHRPERIDRLAAAQLRRLGVPSLDQVLHDHRHGAHTIILDLKSQPRKVMQHVRRQAAHLEIDPSRILYLIWTDDIVLPHTIWGTVYRARDYRFSTARPARCGGIACKFTGSPSNRACIDRALAQSIPVNLYSPQPANVAAMARLYGSRCSLTIDVAPGKRHTPTHLVSEHRLAARSASAPKKSDRKIQPQKKTIHTTHRRKHHHHPRG